MRRNTGRTPDLRKQVGITRETASMANEQDASKDIVGISPLLLGLLRLLRLLSVL